MSISVTTTTRMLTFAVFAVACTAQAATIHVSTTGDDAGDGLIWATAKRTVQAGLDTAATGDDVWVAAGTYAENIVLRAGVGLYGGFAGDEMDLSQRNWAVNVTVLDGGQTGSVVTASRLGSERSTVDGFFIRNGSGTRLGTNLCGGGIFCYYSSPTIANNTIASNSVAGNYGSGGGIYCGMSSAAIKNNVINANVAVLGGGIYLDDFSGTVISNRVSNNIGSNQGGGIYCGFYAPVIRNNVISGNSGGFGGGIYSRPGDAAIIVNNTICRNSAFAGSGVFCVNSSATIANTIVACNSSGIAVGGPSIPILKHNCVYGNGTTNYWGLPDPSGVNGNISFDPLLVRLPDAGFDGLWGTADDDYGDLHLQPGSPCIDTGDPAYTPAPGEKDMDGQPRVIRSRVDIGADEWALPGDANGDGNVDMVDLLMLVDAWGTTAGDAAYDPACDFNHDSLVDVVDLLMLVENWGQSGQTVSLSLSGSPMADQAGAAATVTATLSRPAPIDLTISFTFSGTATKDIDYTASATQIVIPAGQTTGSPITLTLIGNNSYNPARTITLTGQPLSGASYAGSNQVVVDLSGTTATQYKAKGEAWLAQNATQPGVVTLPSGLQYKVITPGAGAKPDANDRVFAAYTGKLIDGTVFDSSSGVAFGVSEVIAGWTEALQLMPLNSKWMLYIPSNLAYGEPGRGSIPPNAALVFEVELKGIEPLP